MQPRDLVGANLNPKLAHPKNNVPRMSLDILNFMPGGMLLNYELLCIYNIYIIYLFTCASV